MRLSLLSVAVVLALVGCASHPAPAPVAPTPVVLPTLPPVPAPAPVVTEPTPTPADNGPEMTADGRIKVKGDGWELDVPGDAGWRRMPSQAFELAMMNPTTRTLTLLGKDDSTDAVAVLVKAKIAEAKKAGGAVVSQRPVTVNGSAGVTVEFKLKNARVQSWLFSTGTTAFTLSCGGPEENAKANKPICEDLAAHLFLGTKP